MKNPSKKNVTHVSIRADAGPSVGYGHVLRTLTVAHLLNKKAGMKIRYLMDSTSDTALPQKAGCEIILLDDNSLNNLASIVYPEDGPLILDTYSMSKSTLIQIRKKGYFTVCFDDGMRFNEYHANIVIDSSPDADELPYSGLPITRFCLGPSYYPLRKEFIEQRKIMKYRGNNKHVIVAFGGSDPYDQSDRIVRILSKYFHDLSATVILGPGYSGQLKNEKPCTKNIILKHDAQNVAKIFSEADMAISGAGGTVLELAYLGIPTIVMVLSEDQRHIASSLARVGAIMNLGNYSEVTDEQIRQMLEELLSSISKIRQLRRAQKHLIDGNGAERIANAIIDEWTLYASSLSNRALN